MSSLQLIDVNRNRKDDVPPGSPKPGTEAWCEALEHLALKRALATAATAKLTAGDVVYLMKIRRRLLDERGPRRPAIWVDPDSWKAA